MAACLASRCCSCRPPALDKALDKALAAARHTPPNTPRLWPRQIILLGDSAVGKSKLVERFLMDG